LQAVTWILLILNKHKSICTVMLEISTATTPNVPVNTCGVWAIALHGRLLAPLSEMGQVETPAINQIFEAYTACQEICPAFGCFV
jgi:hypothetical protein